MYRMLLALVVVGLLLALVAPGAALSQEEKKAVSTEKAEKAPMPKADKELYVKVTKTWYDWDRVGSVIGLALLALILFQLYLLRGELEKLNEKGGG